jgi:hypothetical protein
VPVQLGLVFALQPRSLEVAMKARLFGALAALTMLSGAPVVAHHAFSAEFDRDKPVSITGTVSKIDWANPHSYLFVDVKGDKPAQTMTWRFELGGVRALERRGWQRSTINAGDEVTVTGWRAKDGTHYGNASDVKLANGRDLNAASSYFDRSSKNIGN